LRSVFCQLGLELTGATNYPAIWRLITAAHTTWPWTAEPRFSGSVGAGCSMTVTWTLEIGPRQAQPGSRCRQRLPGCGQYRSADHASKVRRAVRSTSQASNTRPSGIGPAQVNHCDQSRLGWLVMALTCSGIAAPIAGITPSQCQVGPRVPPATAALRSISTSAAVHALPERRRGIARRLG
jgi:hypothetical protein